MIFCVSNTCKRAYVFSVYKFWYFDVSKQMSLKLTFSGIPQVFVHNSSCSRRCSLSEKCPYLDLFWSAFSRIRTEYGKILRISPYSVRMRENTEQKLLRICTLFTQWLYSRMFYRITCNSTGKNSNKSFFQWTLKNFWEQFFQIALLR